MVKPFFSWASATKNQKFSGMGNFFLYFLNKQKTIPKRIGLNKITWLDQNNHVLIISIVIDSLQGCINDFFTKLRGALPRLLTPPHPPPPQAYSGGAIRGAVPSPPQNVGANVFAFSSLDFQNKEGEKWESNKEKRGRNGKTKYVYDNSVSEQSRLLLMHFWPI